MTRWIILVLAVVGLSAAATVAINSMPTRGDADLLPAFTTGSDTPTGPLPEVEVVGDPVHRFGLMAQDTKGHKSWVIKNVGEGDLILTGGHPSCSCTLLNLREGTNVTVKPGGEYELKVEWETRQNQGPYHKNASLYTNDPKHQELTFLVEGEVQPSIIVMPTEAELTAGSIENDEPHEFHIIVTSPDHPEMKILGYSSSRPEMLSFKAQDLTKDEKAQLKFPTGYKVTVTVNPIPILGPFHEEFTVKTDHPTRPEIHREIAGTILGPITFNPGSLRIAEVDPKKGASVTTRVTVRNSDGATTFKAVNPSEKLKITVVPVDMKTEAGSSEKPIRYYDLTATLQPGAPTGVINENIVLETNHPRASQVKLPFHALVIGE
jgi:hypothetical protein